ncbi:MAG TPA: aminotransferase class I/II-fold pyridoxal phosphate-dependent enzyme [Polyangiaceae bacterium]|nr:aminotransferase class I/II-fold pyridoxal phosphate-dependent enzyme [Polyangiaceae bacterium]
MKPGWRIETALIHAGEPRPRIGGAVNLPIFQSSTFEMGGTEAGYHDVRYIRLNNTPNHVVVQGKLAALEGAEAALVTGSGMAAISATLLSVLAQGDHILCHRSLYGGTFDFITKDLPRFGIAFTLVDGDDPRTWSAAVRRTTRAFYVETLTNPLLEVLDLEGVVTFCRERGLVSIVDNTCATPVNYRPIERGFDLAVHSASKYLNGHTDIVAGAVVGSAVHVGEAKRKLDHLGGTLDPHACFLLHRGLKTLSLRVRHQNETALRLAAFLEKHAAVTRVNYPGLARHPRHARAAAWFAGFGGLMSFELGDDVAAARRFMERVRLPVDAPSLGGAETLMTRPATTSHSGLSAGERKEQGISDALIRISVGLEAADDLIEDFAQALT